ncbi:Holocytochrome c synthase/heme-lyase [Phaffia rhodozyma]|uniref:Holocytochrome c-type synthase n=1 Tax=Phaffia rhodozyma TaxID=264483 RepID=A0A0F7SU69_PHARH|nr:Holocytochrome c synthase/heme-lyase [Phaffia rhodozyma]
MWPFSSASASSPSSSPPSSANTNTNTDTNTNTPPIASPLQPTSTPEDKCPVDEPTRLRWLANQTSSSSSSPSPHPFSGASSTPAIPATPAAPAESCPVDETTRLRWLANQSSGPHPFSSSSPSSPSPTSSSPSTASSLGTDRVTSSIPRYSQSTLPTLSPHADAASYYDPDQTNWVYPSEAQFFSAMQRKNHKPREEDMKNIVPIHNAVNEKAWKDVLEWEKGLGGQDCGGVKLVTFRGTPGEWTPRSLMNRVLWGYQAPFDTHRWLVTRCGKEVTYIIDFYAGRSGDISFFLDVRPALDSWEGIKTRLGLGKDHPSQE